MDRFYISVDSLKIFFPPSFQFNVNLFRSPKPVPPQAPNKFSPHTKSFASPPTFKNTSQSSSTQQASPCLPSLPSTPSLDFFQLIPKDCVNDVNGSGSILRDDIDSSNLLELTPNKSYPELNSPISEGKLADNSPASQFPISASGIAFDIAENDLHRIQKMSDADFDLIVQSSKASSDCIDQNKQETYTKQPIINSTGEPAPNAPASLWLQYIRAAPIQVQTQLYQQAFLVCPFSLLFKYSFSTFLSGIYSTFRCF